VRWLVYIIVQRCCCGWPGAGGTTGQGRPGKTIAKPAPAPPAAASAARPAWASASFCSRWKQTKIYIKSNNSTVKLLMTMSQRIRDVYPGSQIQIFVHPRSRILDLGSQISDPGSRIPNSYFWELSDNCLGKKFHNSLKFGINFFLQKLNNFTLCEICG